MSDHFRRMYACGVHVESQCRSIGHDKQTIVGKQECPQCGDRSSAPWDAWKKADALEQAKALERLTREVERLRGLITAAIPDRFEGDLGSDALVDLWAEARAIREASNGGTKTL